MCHLIQLPHLHTWALGGPPPDYSTSPLPLVFQPLTEFTLLEGAIHGWFPLLKRLERCVSAPLHRVKESLRSLRTPHSPDTIIGASFSSTVQMFRNLARLNVGPCCCSPSGNGQCAFKLNDDDVTELVKALPRLEYITLGRPCPENTCATTVACLLSISVRCVKLKSLAIHFNTTKIIDDLRNITEGPRLQELRSLPRCTLSRLDTFQIPLSLDEPGLETGADGVINIFPSVKYCTGYDETWRELNRRLNVMRTQRDMNVPCAPPLSVDLDFPFI